MPSLLRLTAATKSQPQVAIGSARVRSATLVTIPAFEEAFIELSGDVDQDGMIPWSGIIAVEDSPTGDGRMLNSGSLRWDTLPVDLSWAQRNEGGHFGSVVVGRIDHIERDGKLIRASGIINTNLPEGAIVAQMISHKMADGISIDLDDIPEDSIEFIGETSPAELVASIVGDTGLPVWDDRERSWNGPEASSRVLSWATDDNDNVNSDKLAQAFLWRDDDANPETVGAYKLGFVDIINGRPYIIPRGVFATAGSRGIDAVEGIPSSDISRVKNKISSLYKKVAEKFDDPSIKAPWDRENASLTDEELGIEPDPEFERVTASAWSEFQKIKTYPAEWFETPSREELPLGQGGVFSKDGRIWGWIAQKNVIHDMYRQKQLTLSDLSPLDTTAFLRSKIHLSNGETKNVGVFTMNAGHHRDGASCETEACQFDDTRTVAGIVTVGMNNDGLWFSGAAAPWLSDWDWSVFNACQPSLHVVWERGVYSLRAVLTVPSPGFPSRLTASAVVDRANIALLSDPVEETTTTTTFTTELMGFDTSFDYDKLADKIAEAIDRRNQFKAEAEDFRTEINQAFSEMMEDMKLEVNGGND